MNTITIETLNIVTIEQTTTINVGNFFWYDRFILLCVKNSLCGLWVKIEHLFHTLIRLGHL